MTMKADVTIFWVTINEDGLETFVSGSAVLANAKIAEWAPEVSSDKSDPFDRFRELSLKVRTKTDGRVDASYDLIEAEVDFVQFIRDCSPSEVLEQLNDNDIIEYLEDRNYCVLQPESLNDQMKLDWLKQNLGNISLEQLENLVK